MAYMVVFFIEVIFILLGGKGGVITFLAWKWEIPQNSTPSAGICALHNTDAMVNYDWLYFIGAKV